MIFVQLFLLLNTIKTLKVTKARGASRTIFEDLGITGGRDDDKVYCVHNDWQSRNTVARTQGTEMNCIFSKVRVLTQKLLFLRITIQFIACKNFGVHSKW